LEINVESIEKYIKEVFGVETRLLKVEALGEAEYKEGEIKGYGYGTPLLLTVEDKSGIKKYVLNTIRPGQFGHEYTSDRAAILIWSYTAFNNLHRHVRAADLGYFTLDGELRSIREPLEFFLLTEYVEGKEYYHDLERIGREKRLRHLDMERARRLAEYIAQVHSVKKDDPGLYRRRIRELIGHGEAIMGLIDSYRGDEDFLLEDELKRIEMMSLEWRWRLRDKGYRLSRVHGDYHPWNILFRGELDFTVLDRSRGEYGEPADDIAALTINYMFFSLMYLDGFKEPFKSLWKEFYDTYLTMTGDEELLWVIQPFYAWRGLVIANPIWYPNLKKETRRRIFNFINNLLKSEYFDYNNPESYLSE